MENKFIKMRMLGIIDPDGEVNDERISELAREDVNAIWNSLRLKQTNEKSIVKTIQIIYASWFRCDDDFFILVFRNLCEIHGVEFDGTFLTIREMDEPELYSMYMAELIHGLYVKGMNLTVAKSLEELLLDDLSVFMREMDEENSKSEA